MHLVLLLQELMATSLLLWRSLPGVTLLLICEVHFKRSKVCSISLLGSIEIVIVLLFKIAKGIIMKNKSPWAEQYQEKGLDFSILAFVYVFLEGYISVFLQLETVMSLSW